MSLDIGHTEDKGGIMVTVQVLVYGIDGMVDINTCAQVAQCNVESFVAAQVALYGDMVECHVTAC